MTTYNLRGGSTGSSETVYDYTRRRWNELRDNFANNKFPGVTDNAAGAYAASKLIFVAMQKDPGLVTDALPPDASYIESYINNPSNPLTWLSQKVSQATDSVLHTAAVNMDKPAQLMQDFSDSLPWYTKPGAIVGVLAASILIPPIMGALMKGYRQGGGFKGLKAKVKKRF